MKYEYDDGGRSAAGFRGPAGDCACRAVSIAMERDYREVFDDLNAFAQEFEQSWDPQQGEFFPSSSDGGFWPPALTAYLEPRGWKHVDTSELSKRLHLSANELPGGRIITQLAGQYCAVVDGVIHNNNDCKDEYFVYGYWQKVD